VVCSRIKDYEKLSNRLTFQSAIYLRSLTPEQVCHYLDNIQADLTGLRALIERDTALQELAKSPLMLSIMVLAYEGLTAEDLPNANVVEERRKQLFDDYIRRMFHRSTRFKGSANNKVPSQQQTLFLLGSLAQKLEKEARTEFLIEDIQVDWLLNQFQIIKEQIMNGLIYGLILGLIIGLFFGLFFDPKIGVISSGAACIQHISVRLILYLNDQTPWDYTRFLDYAVERMFLQRLGMRYRFISKSFQEYFAGNLTRRQEY
jgi:predicted NACHT family NTPase